MKNRQEDRLEFSDVRLANALFGVRGSHIRLIAQKTDTKIHVKGNSLSIDGDEIGASLARRVLEELYVLLKKGYPLYPSDIDFALRILSTNRSARLEEIFLDTVYISSRKRVITPKSLNQKRYIDAIRSHDIVIGIGPAGTGKTYLAMAMAVAALTKEEVDRIVLTRPAVEAGEKKPKE